MHHANGEGNGEPCLMIWLADFADDVKIKPDSHSFRTKYVPLNSEIAKFEGVVKATAISKCERVYPDGSNIIVLAALERTGLHRALLRTLVDEERVQRDVWRFFVKSNLHGRISYFRFVCLKMLATPVPLRIASSQWKRRVFAKCA